MRTTTHNGRAKRDGAVFGTKHNDRNFDVGIAEHIDPERLALNDYANCYGDAELTFEEAELRFYEEHFGAQLQQTNDNYIANGHPERCKTMDEWKQIRRNAPEESIYQIGNMEEHVGADQLRQCYSIYSARLEQWNEEHGRPFTTMTESLHADEEGAPHIHSRRAWHYTDQDGMTRIGQEKALAAAGVELPDPDKPEGRRNNRKMTFDKMCRTMWLDVLQEQGIDVERIPLPDGKHNRDKEEMIRDKYEDIAKQTAEAQKSLVEARKELSEATSTLKGLNAKIEASKGAVVDLHDMDDLAARAKTTLTGKVVRSKEDDATLRKAAAHGANVDIHLRNAQHQLERTEHALANEHSTSERLVRELQRANGKIKELQGKVAELTRGAAVMDEFTRKMMLERQWYEFARQKEREWAKMERARKSAERSLERQIKQEMEL